jgi:type I restriction enzyme S subunit
VTKRASIMLGDIAEFIRGITYKPRDVTSAEDPHSIPCMRTKNIQSDLDDHDLVYIPRAQIKTDKLLREGDILISSANSWNLVGKCSWIPALSYEATFGGFTSVLRVTNNSVWPRYLYHWFSTDRIQRLARSFGQQTTNISNLNHARCLDLEIPLPPRDEQRRIAATLDKADALRRKRNNAYLLLEALSRTLIDELANSTEVISLGEIVSDGPTNGLYKPAKDYGGGTPIIRINNFYDGEIFDLNSLRRLSTTSSELSRFGLSNNDILINRVNSLEYLGKSAIVRDLVEPTVYESNMMRLSVNPSIMLPEVCISLLQTSDIKRQILGKAKNAVNQSSINQADVRSLNLPLPSMQAQRKFAKQIAQLSIVRARLVSGAAMLSNCFSSLQHRAFSGQP